MLMWERPYSDVLWWRARPIGETRPSSPVVRSTSELLMCYMYSVHKYVNAALGGLKICLNIHEPLSALSTRIARKVINLLADGRSHFHSWVKICEGASVCLDRSARAFLTRRSPQLPALLCWLREKWPQTWLAVQTSYHFRGLGSYVSSSRLFLKPSCSRTGSRLCVSRWQERWLE